MSAGCCDDHCVDKALLVLRVALGLIFIIHGYQKFFGESGIAGFEQMLLGLNVPLASVMALVIASIELVGGIAVLIGVYARYAAMLQSLVMVGAFLLVKLPMMREGKILAGEIDVALFAIAITIALLGAGSYALLPERRNRS